MKKFCLIIFALTLLSSCADNANQKHYTKKKSRPSNSGNFKRLESKFVYRIKPSESMQAGVPKATSSYIFLDKDESEKSDSDSLKLAIDDANIGEYSGYFKVGNPYQVFGVSYFPQNYEDFEEIGTASWYGDDFHGKKTANGEIYNMGSMTAAHPTLPLPSMIRVTNLRNGKNVIVRVNDRGPFAKNRIIDVSEKAATLLGFKDQGTTEVKVELLRDDTDEMLEKLKIKN
jgi:rare lipoprotein A (peptidoglycan hydrolase)